MRINDALGVYKVTPPKPGRWRKQKSKFEISKILQAKAEINVREQMIKRARE